MTIRKKIILPLALLLTLLCAKAFTQIYPIGTGGGGGGGSINLFHVAQLDANNGNDATGTLGNIAKPYKTMAAIIAAINTAGWTSGIVFAAPGIYTNSVEVIWPNGVDLDGSGVNQTTLTSTFRDSAYISGFSGSAIFRAPSNCRWSNLTINCQLADGNYSFVLGSADGDPASVNFILDHVNVYGDSDALFYNSGTSNSLTAYDCEFVSSWDTLACILDLGDTMNFYNCSFLPTGPNLGTGNQNNCLNLANNGVAATYNFYNCNLSATSSSAGGTQAINGIDAQSDGVNAMNVNTYGGNITCLDVNNPGSTANNIHAASVTIPPLTLGIYGTKINYPISTGGCTLLGLQSQVTAPTVVTPSAGTATPIMSGQLSIVNNYTISQNADTTATLTIANFHRLDNNSTPIVADGMNAEFLIKNTAATAALTLSFGTVYDKGPLTVGTIAAGKVGVIDMKYSGLISKWIIFNAPEGF